MKQLEFHPIADIFPMMAGKAFESFKADIAKNGVIEPIWLYEGKILDGRNRYKAAKETKRPCPEGVYKPSKGKSPLEFVLSLNLRRRQLSKSQRSMVAARVANLPDGVSPSDKTGTSIDVPVTQPEAAKMFGVGPASVQRAKEVIDKAPPETVAAVERGDKTVGKAIREIKKAEKDAALAAAQEKITKAARRKLASVCDLRSCSCAELFASGIKPDAVITDPPYPEEFLPVFSELAEGCAKAGVPLVAVMSGQSYLPEVMERMCEYLTYYWTMAYMTPGGQATQQWQAKVNTFWKPILLFGKPPMWSGDVVTSKTNDNDKRFHGWGQSESGMADLVQRLTKPGRLVCDPFLGGGTTAVVSLALGRQFVGCDVDAKCVATADSRVVEQACK